MEGDEGEGKRRGDGLVKIEFDLQILVQIQEFVGVPYRSFPALLLIVAIPVALLPPSTSPISSILPNLQKQSTVSDWEIKFN